MAHSEIDATGVRNLGEGQSELGQGSQVTAVRAI